MFKLTLLLVVVIGTMAFSQSDSASIFTTTDNAIITVDDTAIVKSILGQCGITDRGVSDVAVFENGRAVSLDLSNKDVTKDGFKVLPSDIGKLVALRTLICKNNRIDSIPLELIYCSQLVKLDLSNNSIVEIPLEFGRMTNIVSIDMRYNRLEYLPYTIGNLKQLEVLHLWGNLLSTIPGLMTLLPALKELYLRDNRLVSLPQELTTMQSLKYIDVVGNKLCDIDPLVDAWLKIKDKSYRQGQKCW